MMMTLTATTWARFVIWFVLGVLIYFGYGIRNSVENKDKNNQNCLFPCIRKKAQVTDDDQEEIKQPNEFTQL